MKKDFQAIREMASKKLLNFEQKKVLAKLFDQKINTKQDETRTQQGKEMETLKKKTLKSISNKASVKKAMAMLDQADKNEEKAKQILADNFVKYETGNYSDSYEGRKIKLVEGSYNHNKGETDYPTALKELQEKHDKKSNDIDELKLKLQADIYALPMAYTEITEYIDNEIAKV